MVMAIQQWQTSQKESQDNLRDNWKHAQSILVQIQTILDQQTGCVSDELQGLITQLQDLAENMCKL